MLYIFTILLTFIICCFYFLKYLHIFQLEGYKTLGFFSWIFKNAIQFIIPIILFFLGVVLVPLILKNNMPDVYIYLVASLQLIYYIFDFIKFKKTDFKKPLVYTWRVKRIIITSFIWFILLELFAYRVNVLFNFEYSYLILFLLAFDLPADLIVTSNFILKPVEKICGLKYINEAKKIIDSRNDLIVIGITGSYGKTSTKFILQTILSEKYNTYATPDSYNTTFGNVKVVRENLTNMHQVFISEMGARHIGDIKEICNIVKPKYGLITSIGNQHLETFKTIENISKTKYELIDSLPETGIAFFPDDNSNCKELYNNEKREKVLFGSETSDVYATNIEVNPYGSKFTVVCKLDNTSFECQTKLLGTHNIQNILGCIAIAKKLDLTNEEIARGVAKINPIPHRLELVSNTNGLTIVDDAFNSNPWGAKAALDVISNFSGNKIIITPGMIELGKEQYNANYNFGKQIANTCTYAILVGRNITLPIQEGLKDSNFNMDNMFVVSSLNEATQTLTKIGKMGDTVLFENDLPDNFNE